MTEALYTQNAYHNVYGCYRQKMQTLPTRMGFEIGQGTPHLPKMQISVLEQGKAEEEMIVACQKCGKEFLIKPSAFKRGRGKYCSKSCSNLAKIGVPHTPGHCEKIRVSMLTPEVLAKTVKPVTEKARQKMRAAKLGIRLPQKTRELMRAIASGKPKSPQHCVNIGKSKKGDKNHFWRGGITPLTKSIRECYKNEEWRVAVFQRDSYTCQITGQYGAELEAHHIIPFAELITAYNIKTLEEALVCDALWCIDNGITVTKEAHKGIHRRKP